MPKWLRKVFEFLTGSKARKVVKTSSDVIEVVGDLQKKSDTLRSIPPIPPSQKKPSSRYE